MIDIQITESKHGSFPWETINALGPHVVWILFAVGILCWVGRSRLDTLLTRVQKLSVAGIEVEFKQTLKQAADARGEDVPAVDLGRAARRLAQSTALLTGARLLWIDDEPDNNRFERALLEGAGASVNQVVSSEQAWQSLNRAAYDLIISDIRRGVDDKAGTDLLQTLVAEGRKTPVIFYVGEISGPVPEGAFGIADSPDELVHLVLDALARRRS
jgi:PleD family two-component response regulator